MKLHAALSVSYSYGKITYELRLPGQQTGLVVTHLISDEDLAQLQSLSSNLLRRSSSDSFEREAKLTGERLYRALIPRELGDALKSIHGPLLINTETFESLGLPFELLYADHEFWGLRFSIGNQVSNEHWKHHSQLAFKLRALIICSNPRGDLKFVEDEGHRVFEELSRAGVEVRFIPSSQASVERVCERLAEGYDIIHYCGHVIAGSKTTGAGGLLLAREQVLSAAQIASELHGYPCVFLNGCASARGGALADGDSVDKDASSVAHGFIGGGARAIVATASDVSDQYAAHVATEFYRHAVAGMPLGEALRCARLHGRTVARGSPTWLSFILHGDAGQILIGPWAEVCLAARKRYSNLSTIGGSKAIDTLYQLPNLLSRLTASETGSGAGIPEPPYRDIVRWEEGAFPRSRGRLGNQYGLAEVLRNFLGVSKGFSAIPRFVALGPPGSGKTSLARYLAWKAADGTLRVKKGGGVVFKGPGRPVVPVLVHLSEWQAWAAPREHRPNFDLAAYLESMPDPSPEAPQWDQWLKRGDVLLILDGLDELNTQPRTREFIENALNTALHEYPSCPTIITCRSISFESYELLLQPLPVFVLAPLGERRDDYVRAYFADSPEVADKLIQQLNATTQLQALVSNPLLLDIICYLANEDPQARVAATQSELYHHVINKLILRTRRIEIVPDPGLDSEQKRRIIEEVALGLFLKGKHGSCSASELRVELEVALTAIGHDKEIATKLREDLTSNAGLLRGDEEQGFIFLHLTLQEFMAATAVARLVNNDGWNVRIESGGRKTRLHRFVDQCSREPAWREVIVLLAGQLERPAHLLRRFVEERRDSWTRDRRALAARCLPEIQLERRVVLKELIEDLGKELVGAILECAGSTAMVEAVGAMARINPELTNDDKSSLTFIDYLIGRLFDPIEDVRFAAARAIHALPTGTVLPPTSLKILIMALCHPTWDLRLAACEALGRWASVGNSNLLDGLTGLLSAGAWDVRAFAAMAVSRVGSPGVNHPGLLERLADLFYDSDVGAKATDKREGEDVVGEDRLTVVDVQTKRNVPEILPGELHRVGWGLMLKRLRLIEFAKGGPRNAALRALCHLGPTAATNDSFADRLREMSRDRTCPARTISGPTQQLGIGTGTEPGDGPVCVAVAIVVASFGSAAARHPPLLEALRNLLDDNASASVRSTAAAVVGTLGETAANEPSLLRKLGELLEDEDPSVRAAAISAVGALGENAGPPLIEQLANDLDKESAPFARATAASTIGALGVAAVGHPGLRATLSRLLDDSETTVQAAAVSAVGELGVAAGSDRTMVEHVAPLCWKAALIMDAVASRAEEGDVDADAESISTVSPWITLGLGDVHWIKEALVIDRRQHSLAAWMHWTLVSNPGQLPRLKPAIESFIDVPAEQALSSLVRGIAALVNHHPPPLKQNIGMMRHEKAFMRATAALAIGEAGAAVGHDAPLVEGLVRLLDDGEQMVRVAATKAVGKLGETVPRHPQLIEAIARHLRTGDTAVRTAAAATIAKLGAAAAEDARLRDGLAALAKDPAADMRGIAAMVLGKVGAVSKEPQLWLANALGPLLRDSAPRVRAAAVSAVGQIGARARAYPQLIRSLVALRDDRELRVTLVVPATAYNLSESGVWIPLPRFESLRRFLRRSWLGWIPTAIYVVLFWALGLATQIGDHNISTYAYWALAVMFVIGTLWSLLSQSSG